MFGYSVKDTVITVPEFATAHERRALLDAADVAGLTVLSLMDENTAAALQHAISQTYEEDTNVMFYNMGANSIQVTIVTFGPKKIKDRNVGKLTVRGKGWDATVGGWWFDLKLTDVFADEFNAKVSISSNGGHFCRVFTLVCTFARLDVSLGTATQLTRVHSCHGPAPDA